MKDILLQLGPVKIYSYGFFVAAGMILGYNFLLREAARCKLNVERISSIAFWSIVWSLIGAHALYILLNFEHFRYNPSEMLDLRSGYVFSGGLAAGMIAAYALLRKHRIEYLSVMDIAAPAFSLAYAVGRIGCYFHGCCYGIITHGAWGVCFPPDSPAGIISTEPRIPTQLLSSLAGIVIFTILLLIRDHKKFKGQVFTSYLALYGFTRTSIEFLRDEHYHLIWGLDIGQWFYLCVGIGGVIAYVVCGGKQQKGRIK